MNFIMSMHWDWDLQLLKVIECILILQILATVQNTQADESAVELIPPPEELKLPMETHRRILVSGSPTNCFDNVQAAFGNPQMGLFEPATLTILQDISAGLRYVFQTKNQWTLAPLGNGNNGMQTVLENLVEPADTVLIPLNGMWSRRASGMAERLGANVKNIEKPLGTSFKLEEIEAAIVEHKPKVVYLIHGESSTGVIQRVEGIGEACRKYDCILVLDVVATLGVVPVYIDAWKVDVAFCNSQKGLGGPVGLYGITFGPRAVDKIMNRKSNPPSYVSDLRVWNTSNFYQIHKDVPGSYHLSYPILVLYTLREALAKLVFEGLDRSWSKYDSVTKQFSDAIDDLQLKYYVEDPKDRLLGMFMFHPPEGIVPRELMLHVRAKFGIDMGTGLGPTSGKVIRFGILGPNANTQIVNTVVTAFKAGLEHFKTVNKIE